MVNFSHRCSSRVTAGGSNPATPSMQGRSSVFPGWLSDAKKSKIKSRSDGQGAEGGIQMLRMMD